MPRHALAALWWVLAPVVAVGAAAPASPSAAPDADLLEYLGTADAPDPDLLKFLSVHRKTPDVRMSSASPPGPPAAAPSPGTPH